MPNNNWGKKQKISPNNVKKYIKENVPLNSFIYPQQIFEACNFILNIKNKIITGSNFIIDGGQSL